MTSHPGFILHVLNPFNNPTTTSDRIDANGIALATKAGDTTWMLRMKPALRAEIEQTFVQANIDLNTMVVLDGIEETPGKSGFRICSHDLYGPLPHLSIKGEKEPSLIIKKVRRAACRLAAVVYIRDELARHTGLSFFHHPTIEITPAEVDVLLPAYRQLRERASALLSRPEPRPC